MSTPIKDGGPAFPVTAESSAFNLTGMTLRDWFAGQAVAAIISSESAMAAICSEKEASNRSLSEHAYSIADAMLCARETKP